MEKISLIVAPSTRPTWKYSANTARPRISDSNAEISDVGAEKVNFESLPKEFKVPSQSEMTGDVLAESSKVESEEKGSQINIQA